MSTSGLKALPCKLDIKRHSLSILSIFAGVRYQTLNIVRGAFIIYCNTDRNSHVMHKIPVKSYRGNCSNFYLSIDTSIVPIGALVLVLLTLEVRSFIYIE